MVKYGPKIIMARENVFFQLAAKLNQKKATNAAIA